MSSSNKWQIEWPLAVAAFTTAFFLLFGKTIFLSSLNNPLIFSAASLVLFVVILIAAFRVVHHAEELAEIFGEPLGTLILTLSVIIIEVMMLSSVMLIGEANPTLVRDTMFSIIMLVLNGLAGLCILLGGWKYREQNYNLQGANAYLAVLIPMSLLVLVLPIYTNSTPVPTLSGFQSIAVVIISLGLYLAFLFIQTARHSSYFKEPEPSGEPLLLSKQKIKHPSHSLGHALYLVSYLICVVLLSKKFAYPVNYIIETLHAPTILGGLIVAILVLSPEALAAIRASMENRLQRSTNLLLGSVLASISLTVPAVLLIGLFTNVELILGLRPADAVLLAVTFAVSMITFSSGKSNILLGIVHLVLFATYLLLIFD